MSEEKNHCLAHVIHVVVVQKIENAKQKNAIKYIVLTNINGAIRSAQQAVNKWLADLYEKG